MNPKVCDGCGEIYWEDEGTSYGGPHYQLIREEEGTCDEREGESSD